ncbi:MAG: sugar kinase [Bifidobacteriaceae bacterium]|jgi:2-dehydro-3-deoxygluconokinase|nr:sugar kinase [Bifidobacteriaceae bacterium]
MEPSPALAAVSIGEGQLRLTPPHGAALAQAQEARLEVAGTEGNVMGLLSRLGLATGLISALPNTALGLRVAEEWRQAGLDLSRVVWRDQGRLALYFVDGGAGPVPSRVIYDRKDSCFANLTVDDVDWDYIGAAGLVHLTGITAALTDNLYAVATRAAEVARQAGHRLSVDVNYRSLLWPPEVAAARLEPLVTGADVMFCARRDAAILWGIEGPTTAVAQALAQRFEARTVIVSAGPEPVVVVSGSQELSARPPTLTTMVDRIGAGDSLIGAMLYGVIKGDLALGLKLAIAAATLAISRHGDQLHTSLDELTWLAGALQVGADIVR